MDTVDGCFLNHFSEAEAHSERLDMSVLLLRAGVDPHRHPLPDCQS